MGGAPVEVATNPWGSLSRLLTRGLGTLVGSGACMMPYIHRFVNLTDVPRAAGDAPPVAQPGGSVSTYYVEDFFSLLDELETRQDNGELLVMTFSEYYNAVTALGARSVLPSPQYQAAPAYP